MQSITVEKTFQLLQDENITLIDVREEEETSQAYIDGAQFAPLSDLVQAIRNIELPKNQKVIVYCLKGGRSANAIEFLSENILRDFDVYNMVGGIKEWAEKDFPIIYNQ